MIVSTSSISALLVRFFRIHNRVSLPGLGAFVAEYQPAAISNEGTHITPPSKKVVFRTNEVWNDGYMEEAIAVEENITKEEAKEELCRYIQQLTRELNSGQRITFNHFGTLYKSPESHYHFELAPGVNLLPESFGLQELEVKPMSTPAPLPLTPLTSTVDPAVPTASTMHSEPVVSLKSDHIVSSAPPKKKYGMGWWILLTVVILLVVGAFIFKDQLGACYDKWYYTPAEQELLKRYELGERGVS